MSNWISILVVLSLNCAVALGATRTSSSGLSPNAIKWIVIGSIVGAAALFGGIGACCVNYCESDRTVQPLDAESQPQNEQDDSYTVQRIQTVDNASINHLNYHPYSQA